MKKLIALGQLRNLFIYLLQLYFTYGNFWKHYKFYWKLILVNWLIRVIYDVFVWKT